MIGDEVLRRRIRVRCGDPGDFFGPYGYRFGKWLDTEPGTAPDQDVTEVRSAVAGYLGGAVREGRLVGTTAGVVLGLIGAVAVFLLVWAAS